MSYYGFTCRTCGETVAYGQSHECYEARTDHNTATIPPTPRELLTVAALERIADALERIADNTWPGS